MGDRAILNHAGQCKSMGFAAGHVIMHKLFIDYALKCRNLEKAEPSAQVVLQVDPEHVPAMVITMMRAGGNGDAEKVHAIARRILELENNPKNPWRRLAEMGLRTGRED